MSSESTKKTSIFSFGEPEAESSPGLKEVFGKPEEVYLHTHYPLALPSKSATYKACRTTPHKVPFQS